MSRPHLVALALLLLLCPATVAAQPGPSADALVTAADLVILHDEGWDAEELARLVRRADVLDVTIADLSELDRAGLPPLVAQMVVRRRLLEIGELHRDYRAWERERRRRGGKAAVAPGRGERRRLSDPGSMLLLFGAGMEVSDTDDGSAEFRLEVSPSFAVTVAPWFILGADLQFLGADAFFFAACFNAGFIIPLGRASDVYFLARGRVGGGVNDLFSNGGLAYGFEGGAVFAPGRLTVGIFGSSTWIDIDDGQSADDFGFPVDVVNRSTFRFAIGFAF